MMHKIEHGSSKVADLLAYKVP